MKHPNLSKALAALDDARTLIVDAIDDRPDDATLRDYNELDAACQGLRVVMAHINQAARSNHV